MLGDGGDGGGGGGGGGVSLRLCLLVFAVGFLLHHRSFCLLAQFRSVGTPTSGLK